MHESKAASFFMKYRRDFTADSSNDRSSRIRVVHMRPASKSLLFKIRLNVEVEGCIVLVLHPIQLVLRRGKATMKSKMLACMLGILLTLGLAGAEKTAHAGACNPAVQSC